MRRFVEGVDRSQTTLFPESLEDWVDENNPVRVIDAFVEALDLAGLGFDGVVPEATGRPSYHPAILLKLYIYGYLNRVQSSRRLEREAGRNVELMWLMGRLVPDHKTIADFRKDNGRAIRQVCAQFVALCRRLGLLNAASVAIDGSKFKAVNNRDRNFTRAKVDRRRTQIEESVARISSSLIPPIGTSLPRPSPPGPPGSKRRLPNSGRRCSVWRNWRRGCWRPPTSRSR
jgi:transposase